MNNQKDIINEIKKYSDQISQIREVVKLVYKHKNHLLKEAINNNLSEKDFYEITSILSSQSRSPLWEKYFIEKIGATKNKSSDNIGDFHKNRNNYEYKISGYNADDSLNAVQIRLWQNCNYIITYLNPNGEIINFHLTHKQMKTEVSKIGNAAHGTKKSNESNENIEYRLTIKKDSEDMSRWIKEYKIEISSLFPKD